MKYPLLTSKQVDFELLKKVVDLMNQKEHLTIEGIQKIVSIKASMNLGLSEELLVAFPDVKPVLRPSTIEKKNRRSKLIGWVYKWRRMFFYRYI